MEEKSDVIVVAREGYQVLLNVGARNFLVSCYEPLNLSAYFTHDDLDKCASLRANLEDGNLVHYTGQKLPKNMNSPTIKPMEEVTAQKLEASYTQEGETTSSHFRLKTEADISPELKKNIQDRVAKSREDILAVEEKMLAKRKEDNVVDGKPKERNTSLTKDELTLKVQMDVSPEEFKARQLDARKKRAEKDKATQERLNKEIAEHDQQNSEQ